MQPSDATSECARTRVPQRQMDPMAGGYLFFLTLCLYLRLSVCLFLSLPID